MKKSKGDRRILFAREVCIFTALLAVWLFYIIPFRGKIEMPAGTVETSTEGVCSSSHIRQVLKRYAVFRGVWFSSVKEDTFVIPGLKSTRTLKDDNREELSVCTSMTPQGLCLVKDYLLISAYCHTKQHNSVIYVMNLETREFVKEIVLPGKPHVGGIAYDPVRRFIWVTGYSEEEKRAYVSAFSYDQMENYSLDENVEPIQYNLNYPIMTQLRASFMTWHDNSLYIGYFTRNRRYESYVQMFRIADDGGLIINDNPDIGTFDLLPQVPLPSRLIRVSSLCQGIAFVGNEAFISQSIGILGSSLRRYTQELEEEDFDARNRNASARIRLPAMLEQIATDDQGRLYMIFESAASAYRYWPKETVDRVVVCNNFVQAEAIAAEEGV